MLGKHRFRVGQRVRLSDYGKERLITAKKHFDRRGTVIKVDEFNCPTVLWAGRRTGTGYHPDFIAPDRRRRLPAWTALGTKAEASKT